jgi:hypothetical protein
MQFRIFGFLKCSVSTVSGYRLDTLSSILGRNKNFSSSLVYSHKLWGPTSLLSNGYWGSLSGSKVWLEHDITHPHLVLMSRMSRSYTSPLLSTCIAVAWLLYFTLSKNVHTEIYKAIILVLVSYGSDIMGRTQIEGVWQQVLWGIFGAKMEEVTGGWNKLHEPHSFYSSPIIIRMIKSRRLG